MATSEVVRDINRRAVLSLIRTRQPLSRADLARFSGLQRSTISLIVEELIRERWVLEGPTGRLPRGRRPTYLNLNQDRVIIGVDIRPTRIRVGLADVNGAFVSHEAFATPADPQTAMTELLAHVAKLQQDCAGKMVEGVGITVAGRVDRATGALVFAPNLGWKGFNIRAAVEQATGLDVELENAANACVMAAGWFGQIQAKNVALVTVAEGIGSGCLVNGRLASGLNGMAGEFGHATLDPHGPPCACGSRGCWEVFASNRAALRYYAESGGDSTGMDFADLMALAEQGDARAVAALTEMARQLGRGMRAIVSSVDPEQILIIGEVTRMWDLLGPVIDAELKAQALPGAAAPALAPIHDGGMARLRSTVALVLQKHFGAPASIGG